MHGCASNVLQRSVEKCWKKKWMVKGRNFKDAYPAEAQALETELAQLLAKRETQRHLA